MTFMFCLCPIFANQTETLIS